MWEAPDIGKPQFNGAVLYFIVVLYFTVLEFSTLFYCFPQRYFRHINRRSSHRYDRVQWQVEKKIKYLQKAAKVPNF